MKITRTIISAFILVSILAGLCYAFSADPAGRSSPGPGNLTPGGYTPVYTPMPNPYATKASATPTQAPIVGDLNPVKIEEPKSSDTPSDSPAPVAVPVPEPPKKDNTTMVAMVAAALLVIIAGSILFIAKKKRDSEF